MKNEQGACCPGPISIIACGSGMLGTLSMVLAIITRLTSFAPMGLGPRSFAAGAALLYLMSIAVHLCKMVCFGACKPS